MINILLRIIYYTLYPSAWVLFTVILFLISTLTNILRVVAKVMDGLEERFNVT
jgi:hypothetical protein|tara:strand:- start:137 stop:295 length:159 start_codon:yes stop_codon:yes gene_type:complete